MNTTLQLLAAGQSVWFDNIQRNMLKNGDMAAMIQRGEIRGVTSNPTIFMNAITKSTDYDQSLLPLEHSNLTTEEIFFTLAIEDIQAATDLFLPLYQQTNGADGFVSIEVSPYLSKDTEATLRQLKELWARVNRPNLMVKIPATHEGLPAITGGIAAGININITLIFSRKRYSEVMDAYLTGLEQRVAAGLPIDKIASVASFFVSRVDTNIDKRLQNLAQIDLATAKKVEGLYGKAGIANARLAYADFKKVFTGERFKKLQTHGAQLQRPLWASTSTKNPAYRDVMYIEELIGKDTVDTIPPQTLLAFLDHGKVRNSIEEDLPGAARVIATLETLGISLDEVTYELEVDGVKSFAESVTVLLGAIKAKIAMPM